MLDKQFFRKNAQDIVNKYRKHIFDPAGGGARAKDVYGKNYPSTYSEPYGTIKRIKPCQEEMQNLQEVMPLY